MSEDVDADAVAEKLAGLTTKSEGARAPPQMLAEAAEVEQQNA
jgi:hypothetical protein